MALEIVGGAAIGTVFAALYDVVKISLRKTVMQFKPLLGDLKFTLDSLKPRIIDQIGEHNLALGIPNDEIESLQQQMEEGVKLVCKLSKLSRWSCQIWCSCCNCASTSYTDQLVELDRSLRILLEILKLQEARDVKEALLLARKIHDKQDDLDKRLADLLKVQQEVGDRMRVQQDRNAPESSGSNTKKRVQNPNQGNNVKRAALGVVFGVLFDAVIQVKDKNKVFRRILGYLKSTLDSIKPLIEEIVEDNRVLHLSKKELESFKIQMEKGVELLQHCSKVHQWASYKKYDCINKLLGLDESLQRLLYVLRVQLARDVRESLVSINEVEAVIKKIEKRNVGQNDQIVSKASCPIYELLSATAGLDSVEGTQEVIKETVVGSRKIEEGVERIEGSGVMKNQIESKDSCEVVEAIPPAGINDVIEMLDSTRDVEAGLKKIKGTEVLQNQIAIAVSPPQSLTVALDVLNMEATRVVEPLPPVPECTLPSSTHALDIQFGFNASTNYSKNQRQEMDKDTFTGFTIQPSDSAIQPDMWEGSSNMFMVEGSLEGQQQQTHDSNKTSGQAKSNPISDSGGVKHEIEPDAKRLETVQQTAGEIIIMQGQKTAGEIIFVQGKSQFKGSIVDYQALDQQQMDFEFPKESQEANEDKYIVDPPTHIKNSNGVIMNDNCAELQLSHSTGTSDRNSLPEEMNHGEDVGNHLLSEGEQKGSHPSAGMVKTSEDGYDWRKYGDKYVKYGLKQVKDSEYPRSSYKCTHPNCQVKKKVERSFDGQIRKIIYKGTPHNHVKPQLNRQARASLASSFSFDEMSDMGEGSRANVKVEGGPVWTNIQFGKDIKIGYSGRTGGSERTLSTSVVTEISDPLSTTQGESMGIFESAGTPKFSSTLASNDDDDRTTQGNISLGDDADDADDEESESRRRKKESCLIEANLASRVIREPRVVVQTESEIDNLDDGYRWRKYGEKVVKGNPHPMRYYKCTNAGCSVRKRVERASHNPKFVITKYEGKHNHEDVGSSLKFE